MTKEQEHMTKEQEALKLALEALEAMHTHADVACVVTPDGAVYLQPAITAIREALAQPDAFEQGRQEGMKQERALWELTKLGQEIETPIKEIDPNQWAFDRGLEST